MTNPVANDNLSTLLDVNQRKVDVQSASRPAASDQTETSAKTDSADVNRATERLAQQLNLPDEVRIDSAQHARERLAQLQLDVARDPKSVVGAFANLNQDGFAAAIAEPSG